MPLLMTADLPDMLDELQVPEVLEEMLESENTILQRYFAGREAI